MQLEFLVEEQTIYALPTNSIPRRGSKEYLRLLFRFPETWEKYTKTVYFQYGEYSEPVLIGDTGVVDVPEYFTAQESFLVMLVGIDGNEVCPTNVLCITLEASGDTWESVPPDTEIPAYQQLVSLAQDAAASADAARIAAENAKSAYDIAVENGYSGTESEWIASLKGDKGETTLPVARAASDDGIAYTATDAGSGCTLPTVQTGGQSTHIGKGRQIVFIPYDQNRTNTPTLQLNGGEIIPIRLRAPKNQGSQEQSPDATLPVPVGALMIGVPYTLTFCGKYWLVDSQIVQYACVVNMTKNADGIYTADKTFVELKAAHDAGRTVICSFNDLTQRWDGPLRLPLVDLFDTGMRFMAVVTPEQGYMAYVSVYINNTGMGHTATEIAANDGSLVHYTAENKTDTQKTQARDNIGAEAAPVELTWNQETYPEILDFLRTIESPGRYTFADDYRKYFYILTRAYYDGLWTWYGILVNFSGEENYIETTVYTGRDVGVLSKDKYLTPITRGVLDYRVPLPTTADGGKVLTVGAGGRPAWTAVTNAEEVAV